jgi:hypothetical protein
MDPAAATRSAASSARAVAGRLELDDDDLVVNERPTEYVRKAQLEALLTAELLRWTLGELGRPGLVERLVVRPLLAIVGGRLR